VVGLLAVVIVLPNLLVVQDELCYADAIVVIGGDHKPDRMRRAAELYRQGYAPLIIISAGTVVMEGNEWMAEAEVMRRQALQLGLPEGTLVIEDRSLSTVQNARYSGQLCKELDIESMLLVTSAYHSSRARHIFRQELAGQVTVLAQPAPRGHHTLLWWLYPDQIYTVLYEYKNWIELWLSSLEQ
jgi:uncharacterized SAM-binding protein YcdF (DUF218 family)